MTSFADRFKDKAQLVGRTGEGAMLVQNAAPPRPPAPKKPGSGGTPPLSGDRTQRSMIPTGTSSASTSSYSYRDHVRGLAGTGATDSDSVQLSHANPRERGMAYGVGARSRSGQPAGRPNTLAEKPLGPMTFGQNKYRGKDDIPQPVVSSTPRAEPTTYKPYSLEDWRQHKDELQAVKGCVGRQRADTDEQRLYRALRERMKEFGDETAKVNRVALAPENLPPPKPLTPPPSDEQVEAMEKRRRALEFAKNVPKPKVAKKSPGEELSPENDPTYSDERRMKEAELANLEEQHRRDQEAIAAMKRKFAM